MPKNVMCKNCNNYSNSWCHKINDDPHEDILRDCQYFWQRTNADRIRAMSDEELAQYLVSVESRRRGDGCGAIWGLPYVALEWLKQPAEVE